MDKITKHANQCNGFKTKLLNLDCPIYDDSSEVALRWDVFSELFPANISLFKVNNRNTRKRCSRNMTPLTSFWCFYC